MFRKSPAPQPSVDESEKKKVSKKNSTAIQWFAHGTSPRHDSIPTCIRMGNGVEIPFMGLGTGGTPCTEEETEFSLRTALDLGYTHVDTAGVYGTEAVIGRVLKEYFDSGKLKREDIFVTTKLPCTSHDMPKVEESLRKQLKNLQLDYVDLYLVNTPCGVRVVETEKGISTSAAWFTSISDTWKGMETVYEKKLARSIGLSNFSVDQITRIYEKAEVKPQNIQIEAHLHWPQRELLFMCRSLNISMTAYAPLGSPGQRREHGLWDAGPLADPNVTYLAEKYHKTPAQILLRYLTQKNLVVIPKSINAQHIKDNFESMSFSLSDLDTEMLDKVRPTRRVYTYKKRRHHPEYPFTELNDYSPSSV